MQGGLWDRVDENTRKKGMENASRRSLLGRPGSYNDIVTAVRFAIDCEYLTGEVLFVDGGLRFGHA